jgi:hypothetical protein
MNIQPQDRKRSLDRNRDVHVKPAWRKSRRCRDVHVWTRPRHADKSSSGTTDLNALVMFVFDATKPFSSPAEMP